MSYSITVPDIILSDFRVDYDPTTEEYIAQIFLDNFIIGRMLSLVPEQDKPVHYQLTRSKSNEGIFRGGRLYEPIPSPRCIIDEMHRVSIDKDFRPQPFPGDSPESAHKMYIDKGIQPAKKFAGLETSCTGLFDITFNDVTLETATIGDIDVLLVKFTNVTGTAKSTIKLDNIGIGTGCPNWG